MEGNPICRQIDWDYNLAHIRAWEESRTGYPWIDACMQQLRTEGWLHHLSRDYPTVAFHASITNPFGKGALLSLLRQFGRLHADKPNISVGFFGYPNVGKSSVINTLRAQKVCTVAPVPGETKVWQYVNLTKKIFLIDCPGVVYSGAGDTDTDAVLKGVVRVSNLDDATEHVDGVLRRVKPDYLRKAYRIEAWTDSTDFLSQLARATGKLLRGGEPDLSTAAKSLLLDWQRGRIPFFAPPPPLPPRAAGEGGEAEAAPAGRAADTAARGEARAQEVAARGAADAALRRQVRRAMPTARGMFSEADAEAPEGEAEEEELRLGEGEAEEADEEAEEEAGEEGEEEDAGIGSDEGEDDGEDSDGYGEDGLTWEAVCRDLAPAAPPAAAGKRRREEEGAGAEAAAAQGGDKARKRAAARGAKASAKAEEAEAATKGGKRAKRARLDAAQRYTTD